MPAVLEAHVALDIPHLDSKVAKRDALVAKLEHAIALEKIRGTSVTTTHWPAKRDCEEVDVINAYKTELEQLNVDIFDDVNKYARARRPKLPDKKGAKRPLSFIEESAFPARTFLNRELDSTLTGDDEETLPLNTGATGLFDIADDSQHDPLNTTTPVELLDGESSRETNFMKEAPTQPADDDSPNF